MAIVIEATQQEIQSANNYADIYDQGGYGRNVLNVPHDEYIYFIFVGKLTELVVKRYLESEGILLNAENMLVPDENEHRIGADMILEYSGQEIDVKAAPYGFHSRLLVREDQFQAHIHDIYIGTKCTDRRTVSIYGYIKGDQLVQQPIRNFGTGNCRAYFLNQLIDIKELVKKAKQGIAI